MGKTGIVVYGLTTEGYAIACKMAINGEDVSIADETIAAAIHLTADTAKACPDVRMLKEEMLLSLEPLDVVIPRAEYLIFTPKIRKTEHDIGAEISRKFKSAISSIQKGCSIVFALPTGFHGNNGNISLLEHVTGLEVGKTIQYYYYPMGNSISPSVIGSFTGRRDEHLLELLGTDKEKIFVSITAAEYIHAINILSRFTTLCTVNEICKLVGDKKTMEDMLYGGFGDIFLDDMVSMLHDLRILDDSFEGTTTIKYLLLGGKRGIDGYMRRLVGEMHNILKENRVRISKARVALLWSVDQHEMRGERHWSLRNLATALNDQIGEVVMYENSDFDARMMPEIVLVCTKSDFESMTKLNLDKKILVKANTLIEVIYT